MARSIPLVRENSLKDLSIRLENWRGKVKRLALLRMVPMAVLMYWKSI
jgi:hypothetical protein